MFDSVIRLVLVLRQVRKFYTSSKTLYLYAVLTFPSNIVLPGSLLFPLHINLFNYRDILRDLGRLVGTRQKKPSDKTVLFAGPN